MSPNPTQLRLAWPPAPDFTAESFVASPATREAEEALAAWRQWPGRALALVGPEGAGKSHLASIWLAETGVASGAVLAEDADRDIADMELFRLLERAMAAEIPALLLTARRRPAEWAVQMPDLASRLRALPFVEVSPPDDEALSQILRKLLRDRQLRVQDRVIEYVVKRMERSAAGARRVAVQLDEAAAAEGSSVSLRLAARVLGDDVLGDEGPESE